MFNPPTDAALGERLASLEKHLANENSILLEVVKSFRELDEVGHRLGLLNPAQSYATQVPWWPLISVLGTFSSGKSTFINDYTGTDLQKSGNQAVDDKFTVVCFSEDNEARVLPGLALDADMRFPFFKISDEIDKAADGEGRRIDAYLQLKTTSSEKVRGKILIDSPGFDADAQRTSTLKITNHIIDLSDLVLVFFDARHPEPGAMRDTLEHLVENTIDRADSNKFLFILNQLDTTLRDDNPEEVISAWQRSLAQADLTAGRFYTIYSENASQEVPDSPNMARLKAKRDEDMKEILSRIDQVEVERAYRIVGALEHQAREIRQTDVPVISELLGRWRKRVLQVDAGVLVLLVLILGGLQLLGWISIPALFIGGMAGDSLSIAGLVVLLAAFLSGHYWARQFFSKRIIRELEMDDEPHYASAFEKNTGFWRSIFLSKPSGWGTQAKSGIDTVLASAVGYVQRLNDQFTNPSGAK